MLRPRLRFGVFMAPFHPVTENPTLCLERDRELIQWLDELGFFPALERAVRRVGARRALAKGSRAH